MGQMLFTDRQLLALGARLFRRCVVCPANMRYGYPYEWRRGDDCPLDLRRRSVKLGRLQQHAFATWINGSRGKYVIPSHALRSAHRVGLRARSTRFPRHPVELHPGHGGVGGALSSTTCTIAAAESAPASSCPVTEVRHQNLRLEGFDVICTDPSILRRHSLFRPDGLLSMSGCGVCCTAYRAGRRLPSFADSFGPKWNTGRRRR